MASLDARSGLSAATIGAASRDWENPALLGINKRRPHVPLRSHASVSAALRHAQVGGPRSERCLLLSGVDWAFKLYEQPEAVPPDFMQPSFSEAAAGWGKIYVPRSWECEGHGTPIYTNFVYPIPLDPPFVPAANPTGCYRHAFATPPGWAAGSRVVLHFGGVDCFFYCWLNGAFVGASKDSRLPAEFDVSRLLRGPGAPGGGPGGDNLLAVQVLRWSDATYLEDQDMWRLSGIHRHVGLLAKPPAHIADVAVSTPMAFGRPPADRLASLKEACAGSIGGGSPPLTAAALRVEVFVAAPSAAALAALRVVATLYDAGGRVFGAPMEGVPEERWYARDTTAAVDAAAAGVGGALVLAMDALAAAPPGSGGPALWSAEAPALYALVLELRDAASGSLVEAESFQVGFRHTEVASGRLLHNGAPLMVRGVNRHEFHPATGNALTEEDMLADILLMKRANFNAVRCSHYPNASRWYELCSAHGLHVVDEANLETHGFDPAFAHNAANPACRPEWAAACLDRAVRMHARDRNHACITAWSLGNEAGYGPAHAAMAAHLRAADPSRPVQYEGGGSRTAATDVVCPMYARIPQLRALAAEHAAGAERRPVVLCEYAHSMGNGTGNLAEYWSEFEGSAPLQGGFIWDWADQALRGGADAAGAPGRFWAYGGDFGDVPNDAQFCNNGLVFPDRTPHPALAEAKAVMAPLGFVLAAVPAPDDAPLALWLANKHDFVDTGHLALEVMLLADGEDVWDAWKSLPSPPVPPRSGATVQLPFSAQELSRQLGERCQRRGISPPLGSAMLEVRAVLRADCAWAPAGHVVHSAQLRLPDAVLADAATAGAAAALAEAARLLGDGGGELTVHERRADGGLDITSDALSASISGATGCITRLELRGSGVLAAPLEPCLFRAATDNDRGGSGGTSYAARWLAAGLDRLAPVAGSCRLRVERRSASCVAVSAEWLLRPKAPQDGAAGATAINEVGGAHWFAQQNGHREGGEGEGGGSAPAAAATAEGAVSCAATYELHASGLVRTRWNIDAGGALPAQLAPGMTASLPRVGLRTAVPAALGHARWHGRGPHECYPDRKASGALRQFSAPVAELHVPHIFPQECGGRCDTRWLQLAPGGAAGGGLAMLTCGAPMLFSASRFSLEELLCATHNHLLRADPGGRLHVHLDAAHMGVGGDDSWSPSVHEPYLLPPRTYAFELVLAPGAGGEHIEEAWKALNR